MEPIDSALAALKIVLETKKNEKLLIITNENLMNVAEIFAFAGLKQGMSVSIKVLSEDARPLKEAPQNLLEAIELLKPDVIINCLESCPEETPFRIGLLQAEGKANARIGHMPGVHINMLTSGPLALSEDDYTKMRKNGKKLMAILEKADRIKVTTEKGTNFELSVKSRKWFTDVKTDKIGKKWGNLPCGEIYVAPIENSLNGTIVVDGAIGDLSAPSDLLTLKVTDGKVAEIRYRDKPFEDKVNALLSVDEHASVVGELGIGLNPKASSKSDSMLEAEKAQETIHIAFGRNLDFQGINGSKTHRDFLISNPTILAEGKILMSKGKIIFE